MTEDVGTADPGAGDLAAVHSALVHECAEQARNTVYTATTFYVWSRWLKHLRGLMWILAAASGAGAAAAALTDSSHLKLGTAALALLAVILPGAIKALKLDDIIAVYEQAAAKLKTAEGRLRRAARVWSSKPFEDFEAEARAALRELEEARDASLTPPEWCFRLAQKKVKSGAYDAHDVPTE